MASDDKAVETVMVGNYVEMGTEGKPKDIKSKLSNFLWHGGSAYDAWIVVLPTRWLKFCLRCHTHFPSEECFLAFFFNSSTVCLVVGLLTSLAYSMLIVEYRTRKEREKVNFRNHVIQWFEVLDGLLEKHWRNVGLAFNCTFLLFGCVIQLIACASNIYYINDNLDKRTWTCIFGA